MSKIKKFLKELFCIHNWKYINGNIHHSEYFCDKCGKNTRMYE